MSNYCVLYNPYANNGKGKESADGVSAILRDDSFEFVDMTAIGNYADFFAGLKPDDKLIICGGDGTLNRFVNDTKDIDKKVDIYYYACGTGNDFAHDIGLKVGEAPVKFNPYLEKMPVVTVKGKQYLFLNNVGFGIDGYCTQVGDEMRAQHIENINYAGIAIKGLLGKFKPVAKATVIVDGVEHTYKKAWLAPTMKGRYYGGGMMAAPLQNRRAEDGSVSVMLFFGKGKLKTLCVFPSIFKGKHVKHTEMVQVLTGHDIKVVFDRPCPCQVDGETILDVTEYEVHAD